MIAETPNILITDDDAGLRETLRGLLEQRGFRTLAAADGQEALEIVKQRDVHLLLLDMHMPRLSGLETIRRVRQFKALLPCILMSAEADEQVVREAIQLQTLFVLRKPLNQQTVTSTVRLAFRQVYNWPDANSGPPLAGLLPRTS
ncbi:MAG: response regulator [Pirellulales bacterium]|nr:response regulator [Pirellulales bacterium]